ncbi:MAG: hypothetical protein P8X53_07040 [Chromatiales bacterium]|jgi:hypothetical protein
MTAGFSRTGFIAVFAVVLGACSSTPTTTVVTVYEDDYRGTSDGRIALLWRRPAQAHEDIGVIEVSGKRDATREDILTTLREQGIALGADAIVTNLHPDLVLTPVEFQAPVSGIHSSSTEPHLIGVAIRYCAEPVDDAARARGCREFRRPTPAETTLQR